MMASAATTTVKGILLLLKDVGLSSKRDSLFPNLAMQSKSKWADFPQTASNHGCEKKEF